MTLFDANTNRASYRIPASLLLCVLAGICFASCQHASHNHKNKSALKPLVLEKAPAPQKNESFALYDCSLIEEGGFDCDIPDRRNNPFEKAALSENHINYPEIGVLAEQQPELFRVIGTARTTTGDRISLIQLGAEPFLVHEGDRVGNWTVRQIDPQSVKLEKESKQFTLHMGSRRRELQVSPPGMRFQEPGLDSVAQQWRIAENLAQER